MTNKKTKAPLDKPVKADIFLGSQKAPAKFIHKVMKSYKASHGAIRPHLILSGSSGSGKGHIIDTLIKKHSFTFININAAQLTREGISGNSLSKCLEPLLRLRGKPVVVLFDEFDKLFLSTGDKATGEERSGVQTEILHIISSGKMQVIGEYGHYHEASTRNCLFLFSGAFGGRKSLSPEKLMQMGMLPELLGRVNLHMHIPEVDVQELVDVAIADPLIEHYLKLTNDETNQTVIDAAHKSIGDQVAKVAVLGNVIGYRLIHRIIHQYFLLDGKYPVYNDEEDDAPIAMSVSDADIDELNIQLDFGD
ncbi:AAA family ATPase [Crocinitomicaceae bacterium]|nr:AAA family ATPase [Crocinitomicaceae bacterium]